MSRFLAPYPPLAAALLLAPILAIAATDASPPDLSPAFGATIVSTHPDGSQSRLWLNPDHTFQALGRKGNPFSGTWKLKQDKLCLSQTRPHPGLITLCKTVPHVTVGDTWPDTAFFGEKVTNALVAGRDGAPEPLRAAR